MRFLRVPIAASVVDVDPRTSPADVLQRHIVDCPPTNEGSDRQPSRILLTAEGAPADQITVDLYAQAEDFNRFENQGASIKEGNPARRFYRFATGFRIVVGEMSVLPGFQAGVPATVIGSGGSFPTGFSGGETLIMDIDGQSTTTTFTVGAQTIGQVIAEIVAQLSVDGIVASVVDEGGEIRITGAVASSEGEIVIRNNGTAQGTLGLSGLSDAGEDSIAVRGAVPPGGKIYVRTTLAPSNDIEVLLACAD